MQVSVSNLKINTIKEDNRFGEYAFEPLPTGFGYTLANALRRVLLTSIEGAAATQIKVNGVNHQFTTIEGVKEDIVEITLNIKQLRFRHHSENPSVVTLSKKGAGKVTATDLNLPAEVEIMNKDAHIATLSDSTASLDMELIVESGVGYSPMEDRKTSKIGVIILDALFSPIVSANYRIEPTRFGGKTDLDKIVIEVETDESVSPKSAIQQAAKLIKAYYSVFETWKVPGSEEDEDLTDKPKVIVEDIQVEELPLQTRTVNALKKGGITTLKELSNKTDDDLADIKNLGEKSLNEIHKLLIKEGLRNKE
ncbi:DNA-directed RNA polymerase subunit alpha [Patescibacteria group bacterium]|nr:DNA-directed RNA polymerase subunit alpha [Patescibacteria group bacterium]